MKNVSYATKQLDRAHRTDAGLDIKSIEDIVVPARESRLVSTGLHIAIKEGYAGILKSRSGLASKHGIDVAAGVIDCGYIGEVKVLLRNNSDADYYVGMGDKIAQLLTYKVDLEGYEVVDVLPDTQRGAGGFGSTGV
jgi:dUTP pyrophosphatase